MPYDDRHTKDFVYVKPIHYPIHHSYGQQVTNYIHTDPYYTEPANRLLQSQACERFEAIWIGEPDPVIMSQSHKQAYAKSKKGGAKPRKEDERKETFQAVVLTNAFVNRFAPFSLENPRVS